MLHVDDLIEPRAKQILLTRLSPFPWPHLVPRQIVPRRENHESSLQGIPLRTPVFRQFDYVYIPFPDSKSMTWEFFTEDYSQGGRFQVRSFHSRPGTRQSPPHYP
ncbi:MAG TPA: hypothetical protein VFQ87_10605, partial [Bradyrhizobium sp.]|nr:hypothetical protein [Bradyrhizobium sp.]